MRPESPSSAGGGSASRALPEESQRSTNGVSVVLRSCLLGDATRHPRTGESSEGSACDASAALPGRARDTARTCAELQEVHRHQPVSYVCPRRVTSARFLGQPVPLVLLTPLGLQRLPRRGLLHLLRPHPLHVPGSRKPRHQRLRAGQQHERQDGERFVGNRSSERNETPTNLPGSRRIRRIRPLG